MTWRYYPLERILKDSNITSNHPRHKDRHILGWLTYYQIRQVNHSLVGVSVSLVGFDWSIGGFTHLEVFPKRIMVSKENLIKQGERGYGAFEREEI